MSLNSVRKFSLTTGRHLLKVTGKVTLDEVRASNGPKGEAWVSSVKQTAEYVEAHYKTVTKYKIQGSKAHKSSRDPADEKEDLTLAFYNERGTRILTGHVHVDGSCKLAEIRAGKGKDQGK